MHSILAAHGVVTPEPMHGMRKGNRIVGMSEPGRAILNVARRMLGDAETLRRIGEEFTQRKKRLVVATTHIYARYVLRSVINGAMRTRSSSSNTTVWTRIFRLSAAAVTRTSSHQTASLRAR